MSLHKVNSLPRRGDVPVGLAVGLLALLVALFVPLAQRVPTHPTELPPLRVEAAAVMRAHREALARPLPSAGPEVLAAWERLAAVTARRDEAAYPATQQLFAARLGEATLHDRRLEQAIAARALEAFLQAMRQGREMPLVTLARRHGLAGPARSPRATEEAQAAWFLMRWERMALPTPEHGEVERLVDTLGRLPRPTQLAFAAWVLGARCAEIVGASSRSRAPAGILACAALRRDMVAVAAGADPRYPRAEALGAVEMMLGTALRRFAEGANSGDDGAAVRRARDEADAAFQRAAVTYGALRREHPGRRLARYEMAAVAALAAAE